MAFIELNGLVEEFRAQRSRQGPLLERRERRVRFLPGRLGLRQDDDPADDRRASRRPTAGSILIDGEDVSRVRPNKRNLGMVFQNYALFPNMTARRNIAFGLKIAGQEAATRSRPGWTRCSSSSTWREFAARYPHQLSGGQQQRVALARAIAIEPRALLLDEPLSALDAKIRVKLRDDIRDIQRKLGITTIYVTHDQEEALSISDRVAVMKDGLIEQIGAPFEIYNRPATPYVAAFIGTLNVMSATAIDPSAGILEVGGQVLSVGQEARGRSRRGAAPQHTAGGLQP